MKNILITSVLIILYQCASAQKLNEYKASNGITYHLKDTVKLGRGSAPDGTFLYMLPGGIESLGGGSTSDKMNMARKFANAAVIIKKIKSQNIYGTIKYTFVVSGGYMYPFDLSIEEAIQTGEVKPGKQ